MRLTCPNCGTQYEIDAALLPAEGREVQCSACGHVWFQDAPGTATRSAQAPAAENAAQPDPAPEQPAPASDAAPHAAEPAPKPVDEEVLSVLRDEAAYEAEQRAREAEHLESQPELGLLDEAPWPRSDDERAEDPLPEEIPAHDRREPAPAHPDLPDIDDISETLEPVGAARKSGTPDTDLPATQATRRRSFVGGMLIPIALALILTAIYLAAPEIAGLVPAFEPVLSSYVALVDSARVAIAEMAGI